jgi:aminoglycoside 3-N-acetyltransferase I
MHVKVIRLGPGDGRLAEVVVRTFKGSARPRQVLGSFLENPANYLLVAEADGCLAGFLLAYRLERADRKENQMFVYEIEVAPAWRRRGIGASLLRRITEAAREEGMFEAFVMTDRANEAAQGLYRATGAEAENENSMLFTWPFGPVQE